MGWLERFGRERCEDDAQLSGLGVGGTGKLGERWWAGEEAEVSLGYSEVFIC